MKPQMMIALLLFGVALIGIAGCSGSNTLALNPRVTLTFATGEDKPTPPNIPSGQMLEISGTATTDDPTNNPITSYQWTQQPEVGVFSTPTTLATNWVAPTLAAGADPMPVTLFLTTESLLGGKTVTPVNIVVTP